MGGAAARGILIIAIVDARRTPAIQPYLWHCAAPEWNAMLSRTKLFLIGYFMPSWVASLMMWGDDRTSSSFAAAPPWFYYAKFVIQVLAILLLFLPLRLRHRPSLVGFAVAIGVVISAFFAKPLLEAEYILLNSSLQIAGIAVFLCFAQPSARLEASDLRMLFFLFLGGFLFQIVLFVGFGRMPSHSITDVFVRFNGITNDSLSAGLILPIFIPWVVRTRFSLAKTGAILTGSILTGSLYGALIVPVVTMGYALYCRLYRYAVILVVGLMAGIIYFYTLFASIIDLKFVSILTHLRFFLNLSGVQIQQPATSCAEEFCESFVESGLNLSPAYMLMVYALLLCFLVPTLRSARGVAPMGILMRDTLRIYGATLIVASLVHPVPLIPFAIPLFLILTSLHLGDDANVPGMVPASRAQRPPLAWQGGVVR